MSTFYSDGILQRNSGFKTGAIAVLLIVMTAGLVPLGCNPNSDITPPADVSGFTATPGDTQVILAWTNPTDADFAGVVILRGAGAYPADSEDGEIVYQGQGATATDTGLLDGTPYYYTAFSYDTSGNYAAGAQAMATPVAGIPSDPIALEFTNTETMVGGADAPAPDRDQLLTILQAAETAYLAGDPCGAANGLLNYETAAQALRQAAADGDLQGIYDQLYAAGRRVRYEMVSGSSAKANCPGQERVGDVATEVVDETHDTNTQFQATTFFGEPKLLTATYNGQVFTHVEIPGCDSTSGQPGVPSVPMFRRLIAVPQGAQVHCACNPQDAETIYLNLLPTQVPPVDQAVPPVPGTKPPASVFADKPFVIDDAVYQSDDAYPPATVKLTDLGVTRDIHAYLVEVPAGQYHPASNTMTLYKSANINATFDGGSGTFATTRLNSQFDSGSRISSSVFSNNKAISAYLSIAPILINRGEEFMILTPTAFRAAADTLSDWKNSKGISTRVFEVGSGTTVTTMPQILALIKDEYDNRTIRPAYVLLLGDTSLIPCDYVAPNGDVGATTIATDFTYSALGLLGVFPSLAIGRIPVSNMADATFVVNRIVSYEKTPPGGSDFYHHATIAALFQCCYWQAYSIGTLGTDQRTFIHTAETVRNAMQAAGKLVDRIYDQTNDDNYEYDTTPRRYEDGTALPADIGPGSGFDWSNGAADVTAAWNAGRFLMIHRDHGWPGGWANPAFIWSDADALTNGAFLPVVYSVNCASGLFDQETAAGALGTMAGVPYFAERLLTNRNGGAVGVLGDSRNSPSWSNSALLRGFVDASWPNTISDFGDSTAIRRLGDILNHGKSYLFTQGSNDSGSNIPFTDVADEFRMWHCIGDPTLEMWTANPNRIVLAGLSLQASAQGLHANFGTEGAVLTFFRPGTFEPVGRGTVVNGVAPIELLETTQPGEQLLVTASLPNSISEQSQILVPDSTPPGNVSRFSAFPSTSTLEMRLTWLNPTDPDFAGVKIQRKVLSYPTSPNDGTTVYNGNGSITIDNTVQNMGTYYYAAYAYDTSGNYASGTFTVETIEIIH